ncbi:MAG: rod shape-determining protein MreC [Lentimonas sp.]
MANDRLDKLKPLILLGIFLAAWWMVPTVVKSFVRVSFAEFQAPVWIVSSHLDNLGNFWARSTHSKDELITAGRELARQQAFYELKTQQNKILKEEINRLESILNMPSRIEFRYEAARVIHRDLTLWWHQITIQKGKNYDITEGAAVVFEGGVVGRVIEVNWLTSKVELVSSPNFRMAASFQQDGRPVVYQGVLQNGFGNPVGEVRDAPEDLRASTHSLLRLTSTGLGGTFPPGLTIGNVAWMEPGSSGIFQTGEVQLDKRLLNLHEVTVLVPLAPLDLDNNAL